MNRRKYKIPALFLLSFFLLSACGSKNAAATMHLIKTEGAVQVDDAKGKNVEIMENLGLYSGYGVCTQEASYGWINLDDTKLAKIDEGSEAEVRQDGGLLELYVQHGSLFFNVTEPLAEDESMDIRTSTMTVGIRGTCGWAEVADENLMCVYLLKGEVECTVFDGDGSVLASDTISAGQAAKMVRDGEAASITTAGFDVSGIPDFVAEEIEDDASLTELLQPEPTAMPEGEEVDSPEGSGDDAQPSAEAQVIETLPADYIGEYIPTTDDYEWPVALDENGICSGWGNKSGSGAYNHYGSKPLSLTEQGDGSIVIEFSYGTYTIYPAGLIPEGYEDRIYPDAVNLLYAAQAGYGIYAVWYHK